MLVVEDEIKLQDDNLVILVEDFVAGSNFLAKTVYEYVQFLVNQSPSNKSAHNIILVIYCYR